MAADLVVVSDLDRTFDVPGGSVHALEDVQLRVQQGDFMALIGRSGSGKTTLLNIIAGLDLPTNGTVTIAGAEISSMSEGERTLFRRRNIGFVFQSFGLLPLLSAEENVELALRIAGAGIRERGKRARECLDLVGLGQRRRHRPYELSGGEQQRVAIARSIANRPPLILADEPTGELDSTTALQIFELLQRISREEGATIITTTHDQLVMEHVHHVVELADGRVVGADETSELLAFGRKRRADSGLAAGGLSAENTIVVSPPRPAQPPPAPAALEEPDDFVIDATPRRAPAAEAPADDDEFVIGAGAELARRAEQAPAPASPPPPPDKAAESGPEPTPDVSRWARPGE